MVLHRGIVDFPECVGQVIPCHAGCGNSFPLADMLSVAWLKQISETQAQLHLTLMCVDCVTSSVPIGGKC